MPEAPQPTTAENLPTATVAAYRAQGFVHVPQVLTPSEVEELRDAALDSLERDDKQSWDNDGGSVMDWVADPELKSDQMRHLALHPQVTGIAQRLAGVPLRLYKSELLRKHAGDSAATPPHIDAPALPFAGAPVGLTAWVALTDVPVERGCMSFLVGTHLDDVDDAHGFDPFADRPDLAFAARVTVPLRAGDVTYHHERTVHLAGANRTDEVRLSLTSVYMDASATFDPKGMASYLVPGGDVSGLGPDVITQMTPGQAMDGERFPQAPAVTLLARP